MAKLIGNIRIAPNPGSGSTRAHFEVTFVPYHGRINSPVVRIESHEDLVSFLIDLKIGEDDAIRWAGKARSQGLVLISGIERREDQLRENRLLD